MTPVLATKQLRPFNILKKETLTTEATIGVGVQANHKGVRGSGGVAEGVEIGIIGVGGIGAAGRFAVLVPRGLTSGSILRPVPEELLERRNFSLPMDTI
jgi:hypothetical protein